MQAACCKILIPSCVQLAGQSIRQASPIRKKVLQQCQLAPFFFQTIQLRRPNNSKQQHMPHLTSLMLDILSSSVILFLSPPKSQSDHVIGRYWEQILSHPDRSWQDCRCPSFTFRGHQLEVQRLAGCQSPSWKRAEVEMAAWIWQKLYTVAKSDKANRDR